jgi:4-amino-4-deoxy-L-arabinose transferase-like glycosyltransferase
LGGSDLALRIVPLACAMATAGLLWRITTDWVSRHGTQSDAHTAAQGVLCLWLSAPMVHLLTLALVPDSLLMPIALALMWLTLRLAHPRPTAGENTPYPWRDWAALGLCLGLAGLTKYTAVLLVPGVFGVLTVSLGWRWLRGPGPWLAAAIALLLISPVLWWNHQHGWISFAYQWGHAGGREAWQAKRVLGFVLVQWLVFGPVSWWALAVGWRRMPRPSKTAWLALCMALPALIRLSLSSPLGYRT